MSIEQINSIEESINEKWLPICLGELIGNGNTDCSLCKDFEIGTFSDMDCTVCPIHIAEGKPCHEVKITTMMPNNRAIVHKLWTTRAERWSSSDTPGKQADNKAMAYTMLFYLHDLADEARKLL